MELDTLVGDFVVGAHASSAGIVVVKFPGGDFSIVAHGAADVDDSGGPKIGPSEFLFPRPDKLYRALGRARQPGRFDGTFAGVLATVARAHIRHQDVNFFYGQMKGRGQFAANPKRALRAGPYRELIIAPLSQRGAWFERRVGDVVHIVGLLQLPG